MDGGENWALQQLGRFNELEMLSTDTGYAVSLDGEIFKTMTGGIYVDTEETPTKRLNIYIKNGTVSWQTGDFNGDYNILVYSIDGKKINDMNGVAIKNTNITVPINTSLGKIYLVTITGDNNVRLSKKILAEHY